MRSSPHIPMSCGVAEGGGVKCTANKQTVAAAAKTRPRLLPRNLPPCQDANHVKDPSAKCVRVVYIRRRISYRFFRRGDRWRESLQPAAAHGKFMVLKSPKWAPLTGHTSALLLLLSSEEFIKRFFFLPLFLYVMRIESNGRKMFIRHHQTFFFSI